MFLSSCNDIVSENMGPPSLPRVIRVIPSSLSVLATPPPSRNRSIISEGAKKLTPVVGGVSRQPPRMENWINSETGLAHVERQLMQIRAALAASSKHASTASAYLIDLIVDDLLASFYALADENRELRVSNEKLLEAQSKRKRLGVRKGGTNVRVDHGGYFAAQPHSAESYAQAHDHYADADERRILSALSPSFSETTSWGEATSAVLEGDTPVPIADVEPPTSSSLRNGGAAHVASGAPAAVTARRQPRRRPAARNDAQIYACTQCDRRYRTAVGLAVHVKTFHLKQFDYRCDMCEKAFANRYKLDEHVRTHTRERPFECERCGKRFASKAHLPRHLRKCNGTGKRGPRRRLRPCVQCDETFDSREALRKHVKLAHRKRHVCNVCELTCKSAKQLSYHLNVHSGEKPFECEACGKTFSTPEHLPRHRLSCGHLQGNKPYPMRRPYTSKRRGIGIGAKEGDADEDNEAIEAIEQDGAERRQRMTVT